ncbi:MAG: hypothetical protein AAGJ12_10145 [Bacteroidota bacterium]
MKKIILAVLMLMASLCPISLLAHQPHQGNYTFRLDGERATLTIHFTPKTVLDILEFLRPELKTASKINLRTYEKDVCNYFEERIWFNGSDLQGRLVVDEMDLASHDAFVIFVFKEPFDSTDGFEITVNALTDIYTKPENFVFVKHQGTAVRHVLTQKYRNLVVQNPETAKGNVLVLAGNLSFGLFVLFALTAFFFLVHSLKHKIQK